MEDKGNAEVRGKWTYGHVLKLVRLCATTSKNIKLRQIHHDVLPERIDSEQNLKTLHFDDIFMRDSEKYQRQV